MNEVSNRIYYYFLACIPVRISLIVILSYIPMFLLPYYNILFLIMASGFMYSFIYMMWNPQIIHKGLFDGIVWWNYNRLIHSLVFYIVFFHLKNKNVKDSIQLLLLDLFYGILTFIIYYGYLLLKNMEIINI